MSLRCHGGRDRRMGVRSWAPRRFVDVAYVPRDIPSVSPRIPGA